MFGINGRQEYTFADQASLNQAPIFAQDVTFGSATSTTLTIAAGLADEVKNGL
jgi:hypothetical protein